MLLVPSSLAGLLSLLRRCFTQPTFDTFGMLVVGSGRTPYSYRAGFIRSAINPIICDDGRFDLGFHIRLDFA